MTQEDRIKANIYKEFYNNPKNRKLLESYKTEERVEYFRRQRKHYELKIYGNNLESETQFIEED
jgi:hypothetical protein